MTPGSDIQVRKTGFTGSMVFRMASLSLVLIAAWLLWSGFFKPLLLGLGLFSVFVTVLLAWRMNYFHSGLYAMNFSFRLLKYWLWLGKEILISSLKVTRIALDPRLPISPTVVDIDAQSTDAVDMVILGNSITLTPGTLALDVHDGRILVHALTKEGANEIVSGDMNDRVAGLRD